MDFAFGRASAVEGLRSTGLPRLVFHTLKPCLTEELQGYTGVLHCCLRGVTGVLVGQYRGVRGVLEGC